MKQAYKNHVTCDKNQTNPLIHDPMPEDLLITGSDVEDEASTEEESMMVREPMDSSTDCSLNALSRSETSLNAA